MIDNRLTDIGKDIITRAIADGKQYPIQFTKIKIGDGYTKDSWNELTDLIQPVKELEIEVKKIDKDTITVKAMLSNQEIETGFFYRELGLFALDKVSGKEMLVSYGNAGDRAEYINDMNDATFKEKLITIIIKLENISEITVDVISGIYATQKNLDEVTTRLEDAIETKANQTEFKSHTGNTTLHITSTERTNWNDANEKKHVHTNKSVLDGITGSLVTAWNGAVTHISDTVKHITSTERTNWNDANEKKHVHTNKSVLDGITEPLVTAWNGAVTHISDTVKHITSTERTNWNSAKTKADSAVQTIQINGSTQTKTNGVVNLPAYPSSISGNAETATKLKTARKVGNASFDGSADISLSQIGAAATSHTHADYVNQNAFSNVTVGSTTIAADSATDTLTLTAGSNVTLTPDATNDKVTISATNTVYTHPSYTSKANGLYKVTVDGTGHISATSAVTKADITNLGIPAQDTNTTYGVATTGALGLIKSGTDITVDASGNVSVVDDSHNHIISNVDGLQSALDAKAASSHTHANYVNQNAFSNVTVGSTTIAADSATDSLTLAAGSNVTLTPDATNDKITISAIDTKYAHPTYTSKSSGLYKVTVDGTGHVSATSAVTKADITNLGIPAQDTNTTYGVATTGALGLVKSGTDITVDASGNVSVVDDSHNHIISNIDNLQAVLNGKAASSHTHQDYMNQNAEAFDNKRAFHTYTKAGHYSVRGCYNIVDLGGPDGAYYDGTLLVFTSKSQKGMDYESITQIYLSGNYNTIHYRMMEDNYWLGWYTIKDTVYTHPNYTSKSSGLYKIAVDGTGHVSATSAVTKADITALGIPAQDTNTTYGVVTTSTNGLMSSADKSKLNGIATNANKYTHPSYTSKTNGLYKITVDTTGHISATSAVTKEDITGLEIAPIISPMFKNSVMIGNSLALGQNSYAQGDRCTTSSDNAHAEGNRASANGIASHAEGVWSEAYGEGSHAEGYGVSSSERTVAYGKGSHAEGYKTTAGTQENNTSILAAHAEGFQTAATGAYSHAEGKLTTASGNYSHAEGNETIAEGLYSHAEGNKTAALGYYSHAEGVNTTASHDSAHAEGCETIASGYYSHTEGKETIAKGGKAHAEGSSTLAKGANSHSGGDSTIASSWSQTAIGRFNKDDGNADNTIGNYFIIGNGSSDTARSNCFRVTNYGAVYGLSAFQSSGADYAEYFEWLDGNLNNEDRVGYFVTMQGSKIIKAESNEDYILGIVSAQPCIIGNSDEDWLGRWKHDEFGRFLTREIDSDEVMGEEYIPNPDYDPNQSYIERKDRKEWSAIGMMGVLAVRDDGTCKVNGFCTVKEGGIATTTNDRNGYRVIERVTENIVKVVFR